MKAFSFPAIAEWAQSALAQGSEVISDGLACFRAVTEVGCIHYATVVKGRHPKDLSAFRWINTVISNLKTSFSGTFHALRFDKYADRYLGAFSFRFNRRFQLDKMTDQVLLAVCLCTARPERLLRSKELATESREGVHCRSVSVRFQNVTWNAKSTGATRSPRNWAFILKAAASPPGRR